MLRSESPPDVVRCVDTIFQAFTLEYRFPLMSKLLQKHVPKGKLHDFLVSGKRIFEVSTVVLSIKPRTQSLARVPLVLCVFSE